MQSPGRLETSLRTALAVVLFPTLIVLYSLVAIALALAGAGPERIHRVYTSIGRVFLRVAGTRVLVEGAGLPRLVVRFVAKRQFMDMPIFGQALRLTGNVRVVRSDTRGDVERIHAVMDRRPPGVSILFFAEGTRARDGALHPFKIGAFVTALGYGLPILPVGIAGTRPIWKADVVRLARGTVAIEVGEPIPVEGLGSEDVEALRDRTFAAVAELRARARQRLREAGIDPGGID
jgi:1-acyl-sn-glycerol-3-phosphate acyltransferase